MVAELGRLGDLERGELELVEAIRPLRAGLEDDDALALDDRRAHAPGQLAADLVAAAEDGAVGPEVGDRGVAPLDAVDEDDAAAAGARREDLRLAHLRWHAHGEVDPARVARQGGDDPHVDAGHGDAVLVRGEEHLVVEEAPVGLGVAQRERVEREGLVALLHVVLGPGDVFLPDAARPGDPRRGRRREIRRRREVRLGAVDDHEARAALAREHCAREHAPVPEADGVEDVGRDLPLDLGPVADRDQPHLGAAADPDPQGIARDHREHVAWWNCALLGFPERVKHRRRVRPVHLDTFLAGDEVDAAISPDPHGGAG